MPADWIKLRTEYISGTGSYRELSEKHGVPESTIRKRGAKDGWVAAKEEQRNRICSEAEQKAAEKNAEALSEEAAIKSRIRLKLMKMAENWVNAQGEQVKDPSEYRKMVQSCIDMGLLGDTSPGDAPKITVEGLPEEFKT